MVTIPEAYLNGNGTGTGNGSNDTTGDQDVIDFGGLGTGNGSHGPLSAPIYDPPPAPGESDGPQDDHP
jgi:hypothetical protein